MARGNTDGGATSLDDCYCEPESFYRVNKASALPECAKCDPEKVYCAGLRNGNGEHVLPVAQPGYFMLSNATADAVRCTVINETGGSVCLGGVLASGSGSECQVGHRGYICAACGQGFTRDLYPESARACSYYSSSQVMQEQFKNL